MSSSNLKFLQHLSESELTELVLIPLLEAMNYHEIRYTHGLFERGKDLVFVRDDPLEGPIHCAAAVKMYELSGSVSSSRSIHTLLSQVRQALTRPFRDLLTAREINIAKVYVVTPFDVSQLTIEGIQGDLESMRDRVSFLDGTKLLRHVDERLPDLLTSLPDANTRYLRLICRRFLEADTLNKLGSTKESNLFQLYTGGTLSFHERQETLFLSFATPLARTECLAFADVVSKRKLTVVLADVGGGKTTLLQKHVYDYSNACDANVTTGLNLPVLIPLNVFEPNSLSDESLFRARLTDYLCNDAGLPVDSISDLSSFDLLFDGFDEIAGPTEQLPLFLQRLCDCSGRVVITSRPSRMPEFDNEKLYYRLNSFSSDEIRGFLRKWQPDDPNWQTTVFSRIRSDRLVSDLCKNPLVLTLYAILATRLTTDKIPQRRTGLYEAIVKTLLGEWDTIRRVQNIFDTDLKERVCELLAFDTHSKSRRRFSADDFQSAAQQAIAEKSKWVDCDSLVDEIFYRGCVVRQTDGDMFEFAHLSFQEYFTAKYISRLLDSSAFQRKLYDEWWRGVWSFLFGITRSMDGIRISRSIKTRDGMGVLLARYLIEADFTSDERRGDILRDLVRDVMKTRELAPPELDLCQKFGDAFVDALNSYARSRPKGLNYPKYLLLIAKLDSLAAARALKDNAALLQDLDCQSITDAVINSITLCRFDEGREFVNAGIAMLAKKIGGPRQSNIGTVVANLRRIDHLRSAVAGAVRQKLLTSRQASPLSRLLAKAGEAPCVWVRERLRSPMSESPDSLSRLAVACLLLEDLNDASSLAKRTLRAFCSEVAILEPGTYEWRSLSNEVFQRSADDIEAVMRFRDIPGAAEIRSLVRKARKAYESPTSFIGIRPIRTVMECRDESSHSSYLVGCSVMIAPGTAAEAAGLKTGDTLTHINGVGPLSVVDTISALSDAVLHDFVQIRAKRRERRLEANIRVRDKDF